MQWAATARERTLAFRAKPGPALAASATSATKLRYRTMLKGELMDGNLVLHLSMQYPVKGKEYSGAGLWARRVRGACRHGMSLWMVVAVLRMVVGNLRRCHLAGN